MKYLLTFFFLCLSVSISNLYSQVVTTNPTHPTADQPVIITFDATQCACDLSGYTGDLYAHTGVSIEGVGQWIHVIESWGNNTTQPQLTHLGGGIYQLDTDSAINKFYGVEAGEVVTELCFVFRSADGSLQSSNIFIDVFSGDGITYLSPDTTKIYSLGTVNINAIALFANEMTLTVNDVEQTVVSGSEVDFDYTAVNPGINSVKISATDGSTTAEKETYFFVRDANTIADLPTTDLVDGINYISDTEVTLVLFAPNKNYVYVRGSHDDWDYSLSNQMNITTDADRYWITLSGLTPGQEYIYQYIVDGEIVIADPYSEKVLDPEDDSFIPSETYPGLIAYPHNKTSGNASVFQTSQTEYTWEAGSYVRPDKEDLVIYELLVRDFVSDHNYQTLIDTFSYFTNLGINAIELMPVNEFEGNSSWGYNPSFYFAPDKYYGTKNKLKEFIDLCHKNDIAVIVDMVLNHSFGQSPLVQLYFDSEAGDWGQPSSENLWYNEIETHPYNVGYDFNHESIYTKEFTKRVLKFWMEEYNIDGFRFDLSKGFTQVNSLGNVGLWGQYDASRIAIWKDYYDYMVAIDPNFFVILEHFADNSEETELADYGMMFWGNMTHSYGQAAMAWTTDWDFSWTSYVERAWANPNLVSYMESHDEERMMFNNINYGNSSGGYDTKDENVALKRMELAGLFHFAIPGPKMIWQFEELGYDINIDYNGRTGEKPILWNYYTEKNRKNLYDYFSIFINLKKDHEVFATTDFSLELDLSVKQIKLNHNSMNAVVIGNFYLVDLPASPDLSGSDTWYDYYTQEQYDNTATFSLAPGEYKILTSVQLDIPDLPVSVKKIETEELFIYPSIVSDYITIENSNDFELIQIYDMVGKVVYEKKPDNNRIDLSGYGTGFYIIRAFKPEGILIQKIFKK